MTIGKSVTSMFEPLLSIFYGLVTSIAVVVAVLLFAFFLGFFVLGGLNPFRITVKRLRAANYDSKVYDFVRWILIDFLSRNESKTVFNEYGFTVFSGRQGSGKTISMVNYLERTRKKYPKCLVVTNFHYENANFVMTDWHDFFEIRNGTDGVVFAIDEIQNEYNSDSWKTFPETLLSEITMQRKQRIKIVTTSQVFSRVAKPIREQTFSVVLCNTYLNRLTINYEYDAAEYSTGETAYTVKKRCRPIRHYSFVQSDYLRSLYDTYEKVARLGRTSFIPRTSRNDA